MSKVAIVTGSSKGIGLGIVRALCKQFDGRVYLTARELDRGQQAVQDLKSEGLSPRFYILDIDSEKSILDFRDYLQTKYGGINILVNNAAVAFKKDATEPFGVQAEVTLKTNYWSTKRTCEILFPLLVSGARVVNVSSSDGFLGVLDLAKNQEKAQELKKKLAAEDLTADGLDEVMRNFVESAKSGRHEEDGWHNSAYSVSEIGVCALSRIQQRTLEQDQTRSDIAVNFVYPGYAATDMTGHKGPLSVDSGAESSVYAALLPANTHIRGSYIWCQNQLVDWVHGPLPPL